MVGKKHKQQPKKKQLLVGRKDCWDLAEEANKNLRKTVYYCKNYQRSWCRFVTVELDGDVIIRLCARDDELDDHHI